MKGKKWVWLPAVVSAALLAALFAAPGVASAHRFHGRVTYVHHSGHNFGLRTSQGRYLIHTNHGIDFDGCDWSWMRSGRHVGVRAHHRSSGGWVARRIAPWGDQWWGGMGGGDWW